MKDLTLISAVNLPSFGGKSLAENLARAEAAIDKMAPVEQMHNRSQSQWMRRHLTFSWWSIHHNARQIAAEVARKREALAETRANLTIKRAEIEVKRAEAETLREDAAVLDGARRRLADARIAVLEAEAAKLEGEGANALRYVEGALKDVLSMEKLYDEMVRAHGRPFTEADFERAEQRSQLMRAFSQALRDLRSTGRIGNGNQEFLEQCGASVAAVLADCRHFLEHVEPKAGDTVEALSAFLDWAAAKYEPCGAIAARLRGFSGIVCDDALYTPEDQL